MRTRPSPLPMLSIAKAAGFAESRYRASKPPPPTWQPAELAAFASEVFRAGGRNPGNWCEDIHWVDACRKVLHLCAEHDIDPRDWVRGVLRPYIVIAGQKPWRVHPGHLVGKDALELARARIRAFGRVDESDPEVMALLAAELCFAEAFLGVPLAQGMEHARRATDVAAEIQADRPGWNLAIADRWPHIRWAALRSVLYDRNPEWPDLITAPDEGWRWIDARRHVIYHVAELERQAAARRRPGYGDLDHLGEMV